MKDISHIVFIKFYDGTWQTLNTATPSKHNYWGLMMPQVYEADTIITIDSLCRMTVVKSKDGSML